MANTATFQVEETTPAQERRIDKVVRAITNLTARPTQGLFAQQGVRLNGEICQEPWKWLVPGDKVEVQFEAGRKYKAPPKPRKYSGFDLVFEDRDLIVVDKQATLLTVPTDKGERNTLVHRVSEYLARGQSFLPKVWVVHRLDRGVSGLLVLAKRPEIATALRQQLAERKPLRKYMAVVAERLQNDEGKFESHLATNKMLTRYSTDDPEEGEHAVTHYRVVERFHRATLVEVTLETGRRNQIRVHFAEAGHPVIGDQRYRPELSRNGKWNLPRMTLQAVELAFSHPTTGAECHYKLPLAPEIRSFIERLKTPPPA